MAELLPCPFCGWTEQHRVLIVHRNLKEDDLWSVKCTSCAAFGPKATSRAAAILTWNKAAYRKGGAEVISTQLTMLRQAVRRYQSECEMKAPFYDQDEVWDARRALFALLASQKEDAQVTVITQKELELGQENQALRAHLSHSEEMLCNLLSGLKLWMVGWRDSLDPSARAQLEAMIAEYTKE
jgi:Lar family restriction alleviation protein